MDEDEITDVIRKVLAGNPRSSRAWCANSGCRCARSSTRGCRMRRMPRISRRKPSSRPSADWRNSTPPIVRSLAHRHRAAPRARAFPLDRPPPPGQPAFPRGMPGKDRSRTRGIEGEIGRDPLKRLMDCVEKLPERMRQVIRARLRGENGSMAGETPQHHARRHLHAPIARQRPFEGLHDERKLMNTEPTLAKLLEGWLDDGLSEAEDRRTCCASSTRRGTAPPLRRTGGDARRDPRGGGCQSALAGLVRSAGSRR